MKKINSVIKFKGIEVIIIQETESYYLVKSLTSDKMFSILKKEIDEKSI
jgi:hypothetical protein